MRVDHLGGDVLESGRVPPRCSILIDDRCPDALGQVMAGQAGGCYLEFRSETLIQAL